MSLDRYYEMIAQRGMRLFERIPWVNPETGEPDPRVNGELVPMRWRVSRDEWDRLGAFAVSKYAWKAETMQSTLGGWPIEPDDNLPPNSVIFEPSAVRSAVKPEDSAE